MDPEVGGFTALGIVFITTFTVLALAPLAIPVLQVESVIARAR